MFIAQLLAHAEAEEEELTTDIQECTTFSMVPLFD